MKSDDNIAELAILGRFDQLTRSAESAAVAFSMAFDFVGYSLIEGILTPGSPERSESDEVNDHATIFHCAEAIARTTTGERFAGEEALKRCSPANPSSALLHSLVSVWLFAESREDYTPAVTLARQIANRRLKYRSLNMLGCWSIRDGLPDLGRSLLQEAQENSGGSWKRGIAANAAIVSGGIDSTLSYPTAQEVGLSSVARQIDTAGNERLQELARVEFRPKGTRTFGRAGTIGSGLNSAFAKLDWTGAFWLRNLAAQPTAAASLLHPEATREEQFHAVGLLAVSNSPTLKNAMRRTETLLGREEVIRIAEDTLHEGRSVRDKTWISFCSRTWHLLPERITSQLVNTLPIPDHQGEMADKGDSTLLLQNLLLADPKAWFVRLPKLSSEQRERLILTMPMSVVLVIQPDVAEKLSEWTQDTLSELPGSPPSGIYWPSVCALFRSTNAPVDWSRLSALIPSMDVVSCARYLPSGERTALCSDHLVRSTQQIATTVEDGLRGSYSYGYNHFAAVVECMRLLNSVHEPAVELIQTAASLTEILSDTAIDALRAIGAARQNHMSELVRRIGDVPGVDAERRSPDFWGGGLLSRVESAWRAMLRANFDPSAQAHLLAASRDSSEEVREVAVSGALAAWNEELPSAIRDAILIGATFDPARDIRAMAASYVVSTVPASNRATNAVNDICAAHLVENWSSSPTLVKTSVARSLTKTGGAGVDRIAALARHDDSILVRAAASPTRNESRLKDYFAV